MSHGGGSRVPEHLRLLLSVYSVCVRALKEKLKPRFSEVTLTADPLTSRSVHADRLCLPGLVLIAELSHGYQMRCWRGYAGRYDCLGFSLSVC